MRAAADVAPSGRQVLSVNPADSDRLAAVHATGLLDTEAEEAFDRLARLAQTLLQTPFAFVTVVDDQRSFWKSCLGIAEGGPRQNTLEESFCQYVVASGEPLILGDVRVDERTRDNPSIDSMGVVAWAGFPVHTPDGHVLGTFCVVDTVVREWSPQDVAVLETLAEIASREVALRAVAAAAGAAARVAEQATAAADAATRTAQEAAAVAERARAREHLFARTGEMLTAGLDLPAVWRAVVRLAVPALADCAFVHSVDPEEGLVGQVLLHRDAAQEAAARTLLLDLPRRLTDSSGPGLVAHTGRTRLLRDIAPTAAILSPEQRPAVAHLGATSSISVPLRARGELLAVLTVVRLGDSPPYDTSDVELVEAISARAALALDNALAYDRERRSSVRLQEALLPALLPQTDPLQLAARYRPAGYRQLVGGDWYDAFIDARGTTTLVIGDVAGHDIGAAAAMGQLRAMIRMVGHDGRLSPAGMLNAVDTTTAGLGTSMFATALIAQVEQDTTAPARALTLAWSSAGHPPPVILHPDGRVELLDHRPDRALGLDLAPGHAGHAHGRRDQRTALPLGATLILYTDGLIERRNRDWDAGTEQLLAAVTELGGVPLEQLCDVLLEKLKPDPGDDVAVLSLRASGGDRPRSEEP
jgi:GAF domain-containing protein